MSPGDRETGTNLFDANGETFHGLCVTRDGLHFIAGIHEARQAISAVIAPNGQQLQAPGAQRVRCPGSTWAPVIRLLRQ